MSVLRSPKGKSNAHSSSVLFQPLSWILLPATAQESPPQHRQAHPEHSWGMVGRPPWLPSWSLVSGFSLARFIFRIKTSQKPLFPNQNQCRLITCNKYLLHLRNNMVRKSNSLLQREKAVFSLPTCKQVFSCCFATPGTVATRLLCPWSGDQEGKQTDSGCHSTKTGHIRQNLDP